MIKKYLKLCLLLACLGMILSLLLYPVHSFFSWLYEEAVLYQGRIKPAEGLKKTADYVFIANDKRTAELIREYYLNDLDSIKFDFNDTRQLKVGAIFQVLGIASPDSSILFIKTEAKRGHQSSEVV